MPSYLRSIDFIALILYGFYSGSALSGVWILWRSSGKRRLWGLALLVESFGAAALMTLMGSKYWGSGGTGVIAISVTALFQTIAGIGVPLMIGMVFVIGIGYLTFRLTRSGHWVLGSLLPCLLIPTIFSLGSMELISLTARRKPIVVDIKHDIKLATNFTITTLKSGPVNNPTSMVFGPDNNLYVSNYNGDIWAISIEDGSNWRYATGLQVPVGLAWHENLLYVASHGKVSALYDKNGDKVADRRDDIVTGLPARLYPWHANNGLAFGPDGRIYFAVGSSSDSSSETHHNAASILSVEQDGRDLRTFAVGVRNPYRLAFNSQGDLFGTDNGPDALDVTPGDELNYIVEGGDYGFPRYFAFPPPGSGTMAPVALFPPHASADGLVFYQGQQFPQEYFDNAFVTLWHLGQIYRVQLSKDANGNYSARLSLFLTGLHNPLDMAVGPDGSLYVADFATSEIFKISYVGGN